MERTSSYLVLVLLVLCHLSVLLHQLALSHQCHRLGRLALCHLSVLLRQLALSHQCHRLGRLALLVLLALLAPSDQ